ncbi:MAG: hypothetical protein ACE5NC_07870 [Anaerolineae bacterium]
MDRLVFLLLSQVTAGGVLLLRLVPPRRAGNTFFWVMGGTFLLLSFLALISDLAFWARSAAQNDLQAGSLLEVGVLLTLIPSLGLYTWAAWTGRDGNRRVAWIVATLSAVGLVTVSAWGLVPSVAPFGTWILLVANFLAAALLLGSVTTGMVLAHWYLVARRLPLAPLRRMVGILIVASVLVGVLTVLGNLAGDVARAALPEPLTVPSATFPVLVFWRVAAGIAAPFVLGLMIRQAVVYRTTTAATGLLYVAVLSAWGGTLVARYLLLGTGVLW